MTVREEADKFWRENFSNIERSSSNWDIEKGYNIHMYQMKDKKVVKFKIPCDVIFSEQNS